MFLKRITCLLSADDVAKCTEVTISTDNGFFSVVNTDQGSETPQCSYRKYFETPLKQMKLTNCCIMWVIPQCVLSLNPKEWVNCL